MTSVTRGKLIGMHVYNPDGVFVGTVQDVALPLGEGEIALQVLTRGRKTETIGWSKVGAVGDIIILKEKVEVEIPPSEEAAAPSAPSPTPSALTVQAAPVAVEPEKKGFTGIFRKKGKPLCPTCGKPLTFIDQYQRWYCYNCARYI